MTNSLGGDANPDQESLLRELQDRSVRRSPTAALHCAYQMLGSAADGEDVVQETWLQWADAVAVASVQVDQGRITGIYGIANPEKLSRLDQETPLAK